MLVVAEHYAFVAKGMFAVFVHKLVFALRGSYFVEEDFLEFGFSGEFALVFGGFVVAAVIESFVVEPVDTGEFRVANGIGKHFAGGGFHQ